MAQCDSAHLAEGVPYLPLCTSERRVAQSAELMVDVCCFTWLVNAEHVFWMDSPVPTQFCASAHSQKTLAQDCGPGILGKAGP